MQRRIVLTIAASKNVGEDKREEKRGKKEECEAIKFDRTPLSDQVFYSTVNASAPMNPDLNIVLQENMSLVDERTL